MADQRDQKRIAKLNSFRFHMAVARSFKTKPCVCRTVPHIKAKPVEPNASVEPNSTII